MSFLSAVGKDFKAVFSWLGSSSGQAVVSTGEGLVEGVATVAGVGGPVQAGINLVNSWMKKIITTETIATAAGQQTGSGVQKAAAVLTAIGPELNQYFPGMSAAQATSINNALVLVLNTLGDVATSAPVAVTTAAPVTGAAVPGKVKTMNNMKPVTVGLILIIIAAVIVEMLFFESRQDPSLRIAALTIVGTLVTGILAIASTLMIGKDITQHPPPNSTLQQTTSTVLTTKVDTDASDTTSKN